MAQDPSTATSRNRVDALLEGAIDPHVHSGPSTAARAVDHLELARQASAVGMAAIITKDHDYSGVTTAALIANHHPDLTTKVYSGIALNNVVGGLNPFAVEHTAAMGGKVVWMPTLAAEHHLVWEKRGTWAHPGKTAKIRPAVGVPVLNPDRTVRDDAKEILDVVAATGLALASGHLHVSETWIVFTEARKRGVERLVFTHPEDIVDASLDDVRGIAAMGAIVEHSLCMFIEGSRFKSGGPADLKAQIDAAGIDRTMLCSDLGQTGTIDPISGLRAGIQMCIDLGFSDDEIRTMTSRNAARLFDIAVPAMAADRVARTGPPGQADAPSPVATQEVSAR